ncbi:multiple epidermal growth factor-like domains protein 10 [Saccostrea cucullata]|uniref:multiple epidermal growth factor-like domains protein 10 n=1 Tax=Saccostrea cuccullata TaxID=36930 RepID=UPI002ED37C04
MRTNTINANSYRLTWWYVDLGGIKSIYNIRVLFKSYKTDDRRKNGRFAGFSPYFSNTTNKEEGFRCYINGPELPPLDFNTTFIGHARYVIYFNEKLPEGQYLEGYPDGYPEGFQPYSTTELCEIEVQGCNESGMYGPNCSIECPENCQENRCHILYGTCLGCKPGWGGDLCENVCPFGKYGLECKQACAGHCGGNANCDRVTGHCIGGCASGWTGTLCDKECLNGSYSENCMFNCSGQCLLQEPCDKISGKCVNGCRSGYTNEKCDQECVSQTFGKECRKYCSGHCINNVKCNHITGLCDNGCADGYTGLLCDSVCPSGQFGKNCSGFCSQKCISACHHVDGSCDCTPGWKGIPNCDEECLSGYFGVNCDHQCSRHCVSNDTCNKVNGSCPRGCHKNYVGETCQCKALECELVE